MSSTHVNWHLILEKDIKMNPATMIIHLILDILIGKHVSVTQMAAIKSLVSFTIPNHSKVFLSKN